jgi:hypothetical protein
MISRRWIALLAYDGRVRHAVARRRQRAEAVRLASVHSRVIADLRRAHRSAGNQGLNALFALRAFAFTARSGSASFC